ncbi:response regulator transcription factor [Rhodoplanes roseus]|uniref:DNA-binding response regulator n=1 Tax=Rhodoplanes roseus TaxID=29409 RepID=A0A327LA08_9BRAD|nr:response regulator [Rhodoplanes roseus]RAI44558.1 DNA-binding response regulator [Rhodoplanes roseus]
MNDRALVHIVDDDEDVRMSLDSLLRSVGLETREHATADSLLSSEADDRPGCVVLDVRLPGVSGLDVQQQLTRLGIRIPVVMITGFGDVPMSVRAMKAGAVDFLTKPFRDQDLLDAVAMAIERDRRRRNDDIDVAAVRGRYLTLSPREQQVMMLATAGKLNKQIAGELGISEITVKIHRGAAMRKMDARTFADLVRMADLMAAVQPRH